MTKIMAHRGARNLWAENSAYGFRQVSGLHFDAVEFDLHLTDAGEVVVIHDATLNRTTTATGLVRDLTPDQRRTLHVKGPDGVAINEGIPTFDEILDIFASQPDIELFVELKSDENDIPYPGLVRATVDALTRRGLVDRTVLLSFDLQTVREMRSVAPEFRRQICVDDEYAQKLGGLEPFLTTVDGLVDYVAFHSTYLDENLDYVLKRLSRNNISVWTVNDPEQIRVWLERDIAYLTSDNPVLAREIAEEMESI